MISLNYKLKNEKYTEINESSPIKTRNRNLKVPAIKNKYSKTSLKHQITKLLNNLKTNLKTNLRDIDNPTMMKEERKKVLFKKKK